MAAPSQHPDIRYSVRIFPIGEELALKLEAEFLALVSARRLLPRLGGWNLVLDIGEDTDVGPIVDSIRRNGLERSMDIFISLVPDSDSVIREVPASVTQIVQELGCRILVSYTSGVWASEE